MGNALVRVRHRDGSLRYYKAPVSVTEILKDHSDNVVVSVTKAGNTNILTADLDLLPSGKYYVVSPDCLLSATGNFQISPDNRCICPWREKTLTGIMAIYFSSAASFLRAVNPANVSRNKIMLGMAKGMGHLKLALTRCGSRQTRLDDDYRSEVKSSTNLVSRPAPSPSSGRGFRPGVTPRKNATFKELTCIVPEDPITPNGDKALKCWDPLLKFCHGNVLQLWHAENAVKADEDVFSKERWLEDMIRGADNQWKRIQLEHAFMIEDTEGADSPRLRVKTSPWAVCLPSSSRSPWTSSGKEDQYLSPLPAIEGSPIPSPRPLAQLLQSPMQRSQESSNITEIHHDDSNVVEIHPENEQDEQLEQEDDQQDREEIVSLEPQDVHGASARRAVTKEVLVTEQMAEQQLTLHGASARRAAIAVLQLEIEQAEQLDDRNKQLLKQKMDAMERLSLLKPSSSPPFGNARNFLQKYSRRESSLTTCSPNFSSLDRW